MSLASHKLPTINQASVCKLNWVFARALIGPAVNNAIGFIATAFGRTSKEIAPYVGQLGA